MKYSESVKEISKALNSFRSKLEQPEKDKTANAGKYSYSYASLDAIVKAIDKALDETGLSFVQDVSSEGNNVRVSTLIIHVSGEWIETSKLGLPTSKNDAQAFGSATTYAKRYSICAAFGIVADEDDDGKIAKDTVPQTASKTNLSVLKTKITEFSQLAQCDEQATWKSLAQTLNVFNDFAQLTADECASMLKELQSRIDDLKKKA